MTKVLSFTAALYCLTIGEVRSDDTHDDGWFIAEPAENCNDACQKRGLVCTVEEMNSHNDDVDSSEELLTLIGSLGEEINTTSCSGAYGNTEDVPNFSKTHNFCLHSSSNKDVFSCSVNAPPASQAKQRLCYCHTAENVAEYGEAKSLADILKDSQTTLE